MAKCLLTDKKNFYKANLHCHTTVSDGADTPEQMKEAHKAHGYSILAYSDHNKIVSHSDLRDTDFLPLTACELGVTAKDPNRIYPPTCHFNIISPTEEPAYLPEWKDKEYSTASISSMMQTAREHGYFVIYNHPVWSCESSYTYLNYNGMHAFEIMNNGSLSSGWNEHNDNIYDEMLRHGKKLFAAAGDDNHLSFGYCSNKLCSDSAGTYTMINAEKLDYGTVMEALFKGDFYASEGPEIYELSYDNNKVYVRTSECVSIFCCNAGRRRGIAHMGPEKKLLTEAEFELRPGEIYFRLTLVDKDGKKAYSNAYFIDELNRDI